MKKMSPEKRSNISEIASSECTVEEGGVYGVLREL